jgi:anti-anti-sigma regulatory factor
MVDTSQLPSNVEFNKLKLGVNLLRSDAIEILIEGYINNLPNNLYESVIKRTIEFILRLISSGYTRLLLNCSSLGFFDSPNGEILAKPQSLLNQIRGQMIVVGFDKHTVDSLRLLGYSEQFMCFQDNREEALRLLLYEQ